MCFDVKRQKIAKVTTEDIFVYKALRKTGKAELVSPVKTRCKWVEGVEKRTEMERIANSGAYSSINRGFHSAITIPEAEKYTTNDRTAKVYKFVIPKGSLFIKNEIHYVSDRIKLVSKIPIK